MKMNLAENKGMGDDVVGEAWCNGGSKLKRIVSVGGQPKKEPMVQVFCKWMRMRRGKKPSPK